jgi:toxin ParE1/3/4
MATIQKTSEVDRDLISIWNYTFDQWGEKQADAYLGKIEKCFVKIASGSLCLKLISDNIHVVRCEHHYIFVLMLKQPIIIAVLHAKMDLLARLKNRLA